jgi:hypothetical protein
VNVRESESPIRSDDGRHARAALIVVLGVTAYVLMSRPAIGPDAMRGLLAVEQQLAGRGNTLTEIITVDAANAQIDRHDSIGWWAPGHQQVVYAFRRTGLSLDAALRACVGVSWIVGIVAWAALFRRTLPDIRIVSWVIASFALLRASHSSAFRYAGGETLLWAAFPVAALVNHFALVDRGRTSWFAATVAGAASGALVMIKYSGGILGVGLGAAWIWAWCRRDVPSTRVAAWMAGAIAAMGVVASAGILTLLQGPTPASNSWSHAPSTIVAVGIGGPLAAIADAPDLIGFVTRWFGGRSSEFVLVAVVIGVSALFAGWVAARRLEPATDTDTHSRDERMAFVQAVSVTLLTSVAVMAIQFRGGLISWESRHYQYGAFLLFPFFVKALIASFRRTSVRLRALALANLVVFLIVPVAYGGALIAARSVRAAVAEPVDGTGWLPDGRPTPPLLQELESLAAVRHAVLATPTVTAAMPFAERRLQFVMQSGEWRSERFHGRTAGGVALLLAPGVNPADARVLRDAFSEVQSWTRVTLSSAPTTQLWFGL